MSRLSSRSLFLASLMCLPLSAEAAGLPPIFEADNTLATPPPAEIATAGQNQNKMSATVQPEPEQDMETRLRKLERVMASGTLVKMLMRLDALQSQVAGLQGTTEEQSHALQAMTRRQRDLYSDIDRRLSALERDIKTLKSSARPSTSMSGAGQSQRLSGTAASKTPPAATTRAGAAVVTAAAVSARPQLSPEEALNESTAYELALAMLRKRRYEEALKAFSAFLEKYPEGSYSANALYWVGEANYVTRHYTDAIAAFERVGQEFSDSPKVPAAMLKMAFSHYELKHWQKARALLESVAKKFPQGSVARLAEKRLHRMKIEGH